VGYFVTDNAESNDTCLEELATELGFNKQHAGFGAAGISLISSPDPSSLGQMPTPSKRTAKPTRNSKMR
jgi:hypothetical protein